jgi:hypothetical protein
MKLELRSVVLVGMLAVAAAVFCGCGKSDADKAAPKASAEKGHEAHHGGVLNAIELCSIGHAEVKVEGGVFRCWFVGGENETDKAVRIPDAEVRLTVKLDSGEEKPLVLAAKPIDLAGEKVGDCSYFEGAADWLKDAKKFSATGTVHCKGKERAIRIEFPEGFDPDDQPEAGK